MKEEITPEYIKSMIELYSMKGYNEFSDEDLKDLEKVMCEGLGDKKNSSP